MRKVLFSVILSVLLVPTLIAERNGPLRGFSIKKMVDLDLFESPQQAVLRMRNTNKF